MPSFDADITATVNVDFEVFCAKCGAGLCGQSTGGNTSRRGHPYVDVEPCSNCIDTAMEKARSEGYDEGYATGVESVVV